MKTVTLLINFIILYITHNYDTLIWNPVISFKSSHSPKACRDLDNIPS